MRFGKLSTVGNLIVKIMRRFALPLLFFILVSCGVSKGVSNAPQENAIPLETDLVWENTQEHKSANHGITISFPSDWVIADGELIWLAPSETEFPWNADAILEQETYSLYTTGSYTGIRSHRYRIPQSATRVAQFIAGTMFGEFVDPVITVNINGRDGAIFSVTTREHDRYQYIIVLRITDEKAVVLGALGPASKSEEMKSMLNAIALNIQPLDEK